MSAESWEPIPNPEVGEPAEFSEVGYGLPLPSTKGGDLYPLTEAESAEGFAVVSRVFPGVTWDAWKAASFDEKTALLDAAMGLLDAATGEQDEPEWSEAKPPSEWKKELKLGSDTTWRRHIEEGKLIVDRVTTKLVRIRRDSLRKYRGE